MIIKKQDVFAKDSPHATPFFLIERFVVPEGSESLLIQLHFKSQTVKVSCLLIYDNRYNLRLDLQDLDHDRQILIHQDEQVSSQASKAGPIHSGEWIVAFEVKLDQDIDLSKSDHLFTFTIQVTDSIPREEKQTEKLLGLGKD